MNERKMINLNGTTSALLDNLMERINKLRKKELKRPLTRNDILAMAVENLTIEQGVKK